MIEWGRWRCMFSEVPDSIPDEPPIAVNHKICYKNECHAAVIRAYVECGRVSIDIDVLYMNSTLMYSYCNVAKCFTCIMHYRCAWKASLSSKLCNTYEFGSTVLRIRSRMCSTRAVPCWTTAASLRPVAIARRCNTRGCRRATPLRLRIASRRIYVQQ